MDYGNALLAGLPASVTSRLQRVMNVAARIVTRKRGFYMHMTPILRDLHWLPVCKRIDFKTALLVFKCLNNLAPSYLRDLISMYQPSRSLRSANQHILVVPHHQSNFHRRAFSVNGPIVLILCLLNSVVKPTYHILNEILKPMYSVLFTMFKFFPLFIIVMLHVF
jgi:hypothetical protein